MKLWAWLVAAALAGPTLAEAESVSFRRTVNSSNMEPTLREGDVVRITGRDRACVRTQVEPGDVVAYAPPGKAFDGYYYTGRIVAGTGQRVSLREGRLFLDGKPVQATVESETTRPGWPPERVVRETLPNGVSYVTLDVSGHGEITDDLYEPEYRYGRGFYDAVSETPVPENAWYVLGDSRDNSVDSREFGPVEADRICGVVTEIVRSADRSRIGAKP